jgi:ferritin-like metal-binding protein YciE
MSAGDTVQALYSSELRDLLSATEQFCFVTKLMAERGQDSRLREIMGRCVIESTAHAEVLKHLVREADPRSPWEPCQGMQWLVKDAIRQVKHAAHHDGSTLDQEILAQYQRLSHYHVARVGTAASYAKGLQRAAHATQLTHILADINEEELQARQLSHALGPGVPRAMPQS